MVYGNYYFILHKSTTNNNNRIITKIICENEIEQTIRLDLNDHTTYDLPFGTIKI